MVLAPVYWVVQIPPLVITIPGQAAMTALVMVLRAVPTALPATIILLLYVTMVLAQVLQAAPIL